jgi:hypothetical protein
MTDPQFLIFERPNGRTIVNVASIDMIQENDDAILGKGCDVLLNSGSTVRVAQQFDDVEKVLRNISRGES